MAYYPVSSDDTTMATNHPPVETYPKDNLAMMLAHERRPDNALESTPSGRGEKIPKEEEDHLQGGCEMSVYT